MSQKQAKKKKQSPKQSNNSKKIFHDLYPIEITDLTELEIERAIEAYRKMRDVMRKHLQPAFS